MLSTKPTQSHCKGVSLQDTPAKELIARVIKQALVDTVYIIRATEGNGASLARVAKSLDAPDFVFGPGLENASALLDLPGDFAECTRREIVQPGFELAPSS